MPVSADTPAAGTDRPGAPGNPGSPDRIVTGILDALDDVLDSWRSWYVSPTITGERLNRARARAQELGWVAGLPDSAWGPCHRINLASVALCRIRHHRATEIQDAINESARLRMVEAGIDV